jgi:hypothetical protein
VLNCPIELHAGRHLVIIDVDLGDMLVRTMREDAEPNSVTGEAYVQGFRDPTCLRKQSPGLQKFPDDEFPTADL